MVSRLTNQILKRPVLTGGVFGIVAVLGLDPHTSPVPGWVVRAIPSVRHRLAEWAYQQDSFRANVRQVHGYKWIDQAKGLVQDLVTSPAERKLQDRVDSVGDNIGNEILYSDAQARDIQYYDGDGNRPKKMFATTKVAVGRAYFQLLVKLANTTDKFSKEASLLYDAAPAADVCLEHASGKFVAGVTAKISDNEASSLLDLNSDITLSEDFYLQCIAETVSKNVNRYQVYESGQFADKVAVYQTYAAGIKEAEEAFREQIYAATGVKEVPFIDERGEYAEYRNKVDYESGAARRWSRATGDKETLDKPAGAARKDISTLAATIHTTLNSLDAEVYSLYHLPAANEAPAPERTDVRAANRKVSSVTARLLAVTAQFEKSTTSFQFKCGPDHFSDQPSENQTASVEPSIITRDNAWRQFNLAQGYAACIAHVADEQAGMKPSVYNNPDLPSDAQAMQGYVTALKQLTADLRGGAVRQP